MLKPRRRPPNGKTLQLTAGREALVLSNRSPGEKMSLAIAPDDRALRVDEDLRIVDRVTSRSETPQMIAIERSFAIRRSSGTAPSVHGVA